MGAITRLSFEEFEKLPERPGMSLELDEGELLMEPSPALRHNLIRQRIAMQLMQFAEAHDLGVVVEEMDFRLGPDTVRNPDVAFIPSAALRDIDLDRSPVEGAPALAVEVISPTNSAENIARKIHQYLGSGCRSVWVVYSTLRLVEVHTADGVRNVREPEDLKDDSLFPGLSFSLAYVFDGNKRLL